MTEQETRTCKSCSTEFQITPDDQSFYEKIKVPPPTFCAPCRMQRRFAWRNERSLYKRKSDLSGKDIITLYSEDKPFKVYSQKEWWSDAWDGTNWGQEYNFSKTFFEQFHELQKKVPRLAIFNFQCTNSEYTNQSYENKNCYLCFSITTSEDSTYLTSVGDMRHSLDCLYTFKSEFCYELIDSEASSRSSFLINCEGCIDSVFLFDCKNCQNCIGGVGLRNQSYIFWGEQLTKEEFEKKKKEFDLGSYKTTKEAKEKFAKLILQFPRKAQRFKNCISCTGDTLRDCKNTRSGFGSYDLEDCAYIARMYSCKDTHDSYGLGKAELIYETIGNEEVYDVQFSNVTTNSRRMEYCDSCVNSEDCFGCVGLKSKQYCILNKQYSKEEYEEIVPKIIEHMNEMPYTDQRDKKYAYGEFFPAELSPFAYNETIAQEYFPLSKEEAKKQDYRWKEEEQRDYNISVTPDKLSDNINEVDESITKEIIGCEHKGECNEQCTTAFKITPLEFQFYKKMKIPLPRLCSNCRHYARLTQRNPLKLWHSGCQCTGTKSDPSKNSGQENIYTNTKTHHHGKDNCANKFETSFAPEREEIIYCKECYDAEIA